ncbi:MAG: nucleotide exchange factor GrpE [Candidatus Woesearchaeota archaeon]
MIIVCRFKVNGKRDKMDENAKKDIGQETSEDVLSGQQVGSESKDSQEKNPFAEQPQTEIDQLQAQIADLTDLVKRKQAEFENYQKRMEKQQEYQKEQATRTLIKELLPVFDMLKISLSHIKEQNEFTQGVQMIYHQLQTVLQEHGLQEIPLLHEPFNSSVAQAIQVIRGDNGEKPNTVVRVITPAYKINDTILQYGKVIVTEDSQNVKDNRN